MIVHGILCLGYGVKVLCERKLFKEFVGGGGQKLEILKIILSQNKFLFSNYSVVVNFKIYCTK